MLAWRWGQLLEAVARGIIEAHGIVDWILRDPDGRFAKRGRRRHRNKINNNAVAAFPQWATGVGNVGAGSVVPYPTQMQLGTGTGTPSSSDPGLFTPVAATLTPINNWSVYQTYYAQYVAYFSGNIPAGNYSEAVLLDPNNLCWAHVLLQTSSSQPYIPIQAGQSLTIQWKLQFVGS